MASPPQPRPRGRPRIHFPANSPSSPRPRGRPRIHQSPESDPANATTQAQRNSAIATSRAHQDIANSNATTRQLFGNSDRPWMTGVNQQPSQQQQELAHGTEPESTNNQPPGALPTATSGAEPPTPRSNHATGTGSHNSIDILTRQVTETNGVLPSPAPSDDPEDTVERGQDPKTISEEDRLREILARVGGVEALASLVNSASRPTIAQTSGVDASRGSSVPGGSVETNRAAEVVRPQSNAPSQSPSTSLETHSTRMPSNPSPRPILNATPRAQDVPTNKPIMTISDMGFAAAADRARTTLSTINQSRQPDNDPSLSVSEGRLLLLLEACQIRDPFYLISHQVFCMQTLDAILRPRAEPRWLGHEAMAVLERLLRPNNTMPQNWLDWFANFPCRLEEAMGTPQGIYRQSLVHIQNAIGRLAGNFENFVSFYQATRNTAPNVQSITKELGIKSTVLQQVIFTAVNRVTLDKPFLSCNCLDELTRIFRDNQSQEAARASRQNNESDPQAEELTRMYIPINSALTSVYQRHEQEHSHASRTIQSLQNQNQNQNGVQQPGSGGYLQQPPQTQHIPTAISANNTHTLRYPDGPRFTQTKVQQAQHFNSHQSQQSSHLIAGAYDLPQQGGSSGPQAQQSHYHQQQGGTHLQNPTPIQHTAPGSPGIHIHSQSPSTYSLPHLNTSQVPPSRQEQHFRTITATAPPHTIPTQPAHATSHPVAPLHDYQRQQQVQTASDSPNTVTRQSPSHSNSGPHLPPQHQYAPGAVGREVLTTAVQPRNLASTQLFPPADYVPPLLPNPIPVGYSMLQAYVRDPIVMPADPDEQDRDKEKVNWFSYLNEMALEPCPLSEASPRINGSFHVSPETQRRIAADRLDRLGAPARRSVTSGSLTFRVRCIRSNAQPVSESTWALTESVWPAAIAVSLNNQPLEIRRKQFHAKDLPIDITREVRPGNNTLEVSIMFSQSEKNSKTNYQIGVEIVEYCNRAKLHEMVIAKAPFDVGARIKAQNQSNDDDIQIVTRSRVLSIVDPFSASQQLRIPVRSTSCTHYECFDLDVFLDTRYGNPCKPEQFKCPICRTDARPHKLAVDQWVRNVLLKLAALQRQDVAAITVDDQANWQIQEEAPDDEGDGRDDKYMSKQGLERTSARPSTAAPVVIELD
jgi:hypothetical protein